MSKLNRKHLFVIGQAKSGTSYLHNVLKSSEYVISGEKKEIDYFRDNSQVTYEDYLNEFINRSYIEDKSFYLDSSPHYFTDIQKVVPAIEKIISNSYYILLLRNQYQRCYSSYLQGKRTDGGLLSDNFEMFLNSQKSYFNNTPRGGYVGWSLVAQRLRFLFNNVDSDRIFVGSFHDMVKNPSQFVQNIHHKFSFKNVRYDFNLPRYTSRELRPNMYLIAKYFDFIGMPKLLKSIRTSRFIHTLLTKPVSKKQKLDSFRMAESCFKEIFEKDREDTLKILCQFKDYNAFNYY